MDNKPKPKRKPWTKTVFSPQPNDTDLPDNRMNRDIPGKVDAASFKTPGAKITAAGARVQTNRVGKVNDKPGMPARANVFSNFGDIVPYMSNIANSFRHAPLPITPGAINPIATSRVNFDGQRAETDRAIRGANINAERTLDENTASAFKANSLAQGFRAKNSIAESENNTNAEMGFRTAQTNANIEGLNVGMMNRYHDDLVGAQIANQREQSQNLSNAADKYMGQQQFDDAQELELKKWKAYQPLFDKSGVARRAYPDEVFGTGGDIKKPTSDSTSYYGRRLMSDMDMQFRSSGEMKDIYDKKVNQDAADYNRQANKGKPGYDVNGFPLAKKASGGSLVGPGEGFRDLSGTASAVASVAPVGFGAQVPYQWNNNGQGASSPTWEGYPVKDPTIGWNDWRRKAFPNKEEFMKVGTNFQYGIKNMPYNNVYRDKNSHYSIQQTKPIVPNDRPAFVKYGGNMRRAAFC